MDHVVRRSVTNRDGTVVKISEVPEDWWSENFASGFVDPRVIAPDPDQSRKSMWPERLEELYKSIEQRGVRDSITVTPRHLAPWIRVEAKHNDCFFAAVSGHRRRNGALRAALPAVPIRIVVYPNELEHREDAALLNGIREDLNEVEQGHEFARLRKLGRSVEELAKHFGMHIVTIYQRINLTELHPDIQLMLDKDPSKKRQFPVSAASILGGVKAPSEQELEELFAKFKSIVTRHVVLPDTSIHLLDEQERKFAMQKLMVEIIMRRKLSAVRSIELIREHTLSFSAHKHGAGMKTERYQPHRRKDILETLCKQVVQSQAVDWTPDEIRRIFQFTSREDVDAFLKQLQAAQDVLSGFTRLIIPIRDSKKPMSPEVAALINRKYVPRKVVLRTKA